MMMWAHISPICFRIIIFWLGHFFGISLFHYFVVLLNLLFHYFVILQNTASHNGEGSEAVKAGISLLLNQMECFIGYTLGCKTGLF